MDGIEEFLKRLHKFLKDLKALALLSSGREDE